MRLHLQCCIALLFTSIAHADESVPALLRFAEQYQRQNTVSAEPETAPLSREIEQKQEPSKRPSVTRSKTGSPVKTFTLSKELLIRDQQLAHQRMELIELRQELAALQAEKTNRIPVELPDLTLLKKVVGGLRAVWRGSLDEERFRKLLLKSRDETAQARLAATQAGKRVTELEADAQVLIQRRQENQNKLLSLNAALEDSKQKLLKEKNSTHQVRDELRELRKNLKWEITLEQLKDERKRLSYAAGSALGRDIQGLISERQSWGVPVEKDGLLAGVIDSVSGRLKLSPTELRTLITHADEVANAARDKLFSEQKRRDESYLAKFIKEKGVKQSAMGFWYRIDYAGKGELTEDTIVEVVVKETLTDGRVIQDMELSGKVLAQPLSAYPPLFREAISHLRNHGSLTMVVPPALAYGDTGYPPSVPPNATMIYELRIDNSQSP